jgi:hypothetical protein
LALVELPFQLRYGIVLIGMLILLKRIVMDEKVAKAAKKAGALLTENTTVDVRMFTVCKLTNEGCLFRFQDWSLESGLHTNS